MRNLELVIPFYQQTSNMSCWWASMRMILNYYGIRAGAHPSSYSHRFLLPGHRVPPPFYAEPEQYGHIDANGNIVASRFSRVNGPPTWFDHGIEPTVEALELLSEVTRFTGVGDVPAVGNWTIEIIFQKLIANGPFMFLGTWNGFPHAIVVFGVSEQSVSGRATQDVIYADPADGNPASMDIAMFNQRISSISRLMYRSTYGSLNPMRYPATQPLGDYTGSIT